MKKILLLSDGRNPHTIKWARSLAIRDCKIYLFSFNKFDESPYSKIPNIQFYHANFGDEFNKIGRNSFQKIQYLRSLSTVKKIIKDFKPDVVHSHYASSYGLLGALSGFHPFYISVWGTDIFEFPKKSFIHSSIIKFNLRKADKIFSTSHAMAKETYKYTSKHIEVVPFGVDLKQFTPVINHQHILPQSRITIGTVKSLEDKYGITDLIRAFNLVHRKHPKLDLQLLIVGKGTKMEEYKNLSSRLGIEKISHFTGWVPIDKIPELHRKMDISVFPSVCSESFGVSVVEASACENPVIVTNKGGLPEVVEDGVTGLIVPPGKPVEIANAIESLILNSDLRFKLGKNGRKKVMAKYDWERNVETMIRFYQ